MGLASLLGGDQSNALFFSISEYIHASGNFLKPEGEDTAPACKNDYTSR